MLPQGGKTKFVLNLFKIKKEAKPAITNEEMKRK